MKTPVRESVGCSEVVNGRDVVREVDEEMEDEVEVGEEEEARGALVREGMRGRGTGWRNGCRSLGRCRECCWEN